MEEVWQAIQAGKGQTGEPFNSVNLGSFLQSVGVDMPPSVSTELHMTNLSMPSEKAILHPALLFQFTPQGVPPSLP